MKGSDLPKFLADHGLAKPTSDLLPCPFCGGEASYDECYHSVGCDNGDCPMNPWTDHCDIRDRVDDPVDLWKSVARERWNTRHSPPTKGDHD